MTAPSHLQAIKGFEFCLFICQVFDKESTGKVPLAEIQNCLCSLGEKLEAAQAETLVKLLGITEDEDGNVEYMGKCWQ